MSCLRNQKLRELERLKSNPSFSLRGLWVGDDGKLKRGLSDCMRQMLTDIGVEISQ